MKGKRAMSAWVISQTHLDLIVSVAVDLKLFAALNEGQETHITADNATQFGQMLWAENVRSVVTRYRLGADNAEHQAYLKAVSAYRFHQFQGVKPIAAVKLIACLDYQACETDDYQTTLSAQVLQRLLLLLPANVKGAAYEAAPWGVDSLADLAACLEMEPRAQNALALSNIVQTQS